MIFFLFCNIEFGDGSGGGVFNIPISPHAAFCSQCGILSMTTPPTPPPPLPPPPPPLPTNHPPTPVQIHLHPLMISVKNCWHRMRQGGGRRLIWIKLDRRVDTALKVSRPFMSRWQGVCVLGGSAWDCQRGLFEKAGVYLRRGGMKRSGPQSSSYFKYAPSHLHSFLSMQAAGI